MKYNKCQNKCKDQIIIEKFNLYIYKLNINNIYQKFKMYPSYLGCLISWMADIKSTLYFIGSYGLFSLTLDALLAFLGLNNLWWVSAENKFFLSGGLQLYADVNLFNRSSSYNELFIFFSFIWLFSKFNFFSWYFKIFFDNS